MKDLIVLTACKNAHFAMQGILARHQSLGIRPVSAEAFVHPERDPGCAKGGVDYLRSQIRRFGHAILLFDFEGSGLQGSPEDAVDRLSGALATSGWSDRAEVILINPELEVWVWNRSPHVDSGLGWGGRIPSLRSWLVEQQWIATVEQIKPARPKEAVEAALREVNVTRSSSLYRELASKVSLQHCTDQAFLRMISALRRWFPVAD